MTEFNFESIPDSGALRTTASGLVIIRRFKHEWQARFSKLLPDELMRLTDKVNGSKFLPEWPLSRQVQWTQERLLQNGWTRGQPRVERFRLEEDVGLVLGKRVRTICVRGDGNFVHAYPDRDA